MHRFLFGSQIQRANGNRRKTNVSPLLKRQLDQAAIQCIVDDGHAFGVFRRSGMQRFLEILMPGYHGPSRKTVRNHLDRLYKQHRAGLRETFEKVAHLSLTLVGP